MIHVYTGAIGSDNEVSIFEDGMLIAYQNHHPSSSPPVAMTGQQAQDFIDNSISMLDAKCLAAHEELNNDA